VFHKSCYLFEEQYNENPDITVMTWGTEIAPVPFFSLSDLDIAKEKRS
jgi:hypothetical protein